MMRWYFLLLGGLVAETSLAIDLIAHRGSACARQENSIEAIQTAWAIGADAIELDLRVSMDGVPYLFHDDEVRGRPIQSLLYSEIHTRLGDAAPRLSTVFELGQIPGYYILDLKGRNPGMRQSIVAAVRESHMDERNLVFQSDDVSLLVSLRERLAYSRFFYLARLRKRFPLTPKLQPLDLIGRLSGFNIDGVSIKGRSYLDERYVASLKDGGFTVNVWTINDVSRADYYREIGVDGIITDNVAQIRKRQNGGASACMN